MAQAQMTEQRNSAYSRINNREMGLGRGGSEEWWPRRAQGPGTWSLGASGHGGPSSCSQQGLALWLPPGQLICLRHLLVAKVYGSEPFRWDRADSDVVPSLQVRSAHLFSDIRTNLWVTDLHLGLLPMDLPERSSCSSTKSQGKLSLVGFMMPPGLGPDCWADHQALRPDPQTL